MGHRGSRGVRVSGRCRPRWPRAALQSQWSWALLFPPLPSITRSAGPMTLNCLFPDPCAEGFVPGSRPLWPWTSSQNIVCNANTWFTMESNVLKSIYENIMENKYSNLWDTVIYVLY